MPGVACSILVVCSWCILRRWADRRCSSGVFRPGTHSCGVIAGRSADAKLRLLYELRNASVSLCPTQAFRGKIVSVRNEAAALGALLTGLKRKLSTQRSSADGEKELVARLEEKHLEQRRELAASQGGDRESGKELELKLWRELVAARVRLEEKAVIRDAIVTLEESLRQLQSTYVAGDDAASAARFRPLDAPSD